MEKLEQILNELQTKISRILGEKLKDEIADFVSKDIQNQVRLNQNVSSSQFIEAFIRNLPTMPMGHYDKFYIPKKIYKYATINQFTKSSISNNELWFSNPFSFDDPFDSTNVDYYDPTPEQIKKVVTDFGDKSLSEQEIEKEVEEILKDPSKMPWYKLDNTHSQLGTAGVCCLSHKNDDPLMWAKYADNHRGICLEFEPRATNDLTFLGTDVKYTYERPTKEDFADKPSFVETYFIKSKHWEFQQEFRVLTYPHSKVEKFDINSLTGILLGCKVNPTQAMQISLMAMRYPNISIKNAYMQHDKYQLAFIETMKTKNGKIQGNEDL